jgi:hypothetical protein
MCGGAKSMTGKTTEGMERGGAKKAVQALNDGFGLLTEG